MQTLRSHSFAAAIRGLLALPVRRPLFQVVRVDNPAGLVPGSYFYVEYTPTRTKVSRYLRRSASAFRKADKYAARYFDGDRWWPEVDRCDELRDSDDVVLTLNEILRRKLGWECGR